MWIQVGKCKVKKLCTQFMVHSETGKNNCAICITTMNLWNFKYHFIENYMKLINQGLKIHSKFMMANHNKI